MDKVSSHVRLDLPITPARPPQRSFHLIFESHDGRALSADSEEKREPASSTYTATVDSLKALDPNRPIREADMKQRHADRTLSLPFGPIGFAANIAKLPDY
jgi:hypothetical protein